MTDRDLLEHAFNTGFNVGRDDIEARRIAAPRLTLRQQALTIIGSLAGGILLILGASILYEEQTLGIPLFIGGIVLLGGVIGSLLTNARRKLLQVDALMELRRDEERHAFIQAILDHEQTDHESEVISADEAMIIRPQANDRIAAIA